MATAILNLLGKETNLKRQKTKDQHMHIGQSVLITYCFGLNSWKLSQVACALMIFLVKSKFSQVWILSIDYRQYISLFYHSWLISANLKVYFQESSIILAFILQLVLKRHGNTADIKIVDVENGILLTRSFLWPLPGLWQWRREKNSPGNFFERYSPGTDFWEIFPWDRFYATCHQSRENWQSPWNWHI